jgi:hypothetical protein
MFFEFLEDFNVIGAFDDSLSQITYQPAVERKLFLWMRDVELLHNFQQLLYGVWNGDIHGGSWQLNSAAVAAELIIRRRD